jgi:hypothetical protein|eukprot:COSAG02_NODE_1102_length_14571_cov_27.965243_3_plen_145_part_00
MTMCFHPTGMSGEIGCLLMGLSVVPISSALRRSGASREQLGIGREPSPRERIRGTHDGSSLPRHRHAVPDDDDIDYTEQHRLLDHVDGSDNEGVGVSPRQAIAPAGLVPESRRAKSNSLPNAPVKPEGAALNITCEADDHNFRI